jgi:hypothetical protein
VSSKLKLEMLDDSELACTPTASASGGDGAEFCDPKYVVKSPLACGDTASMLGGCEVADCPSEVSEGTQEETQSGGDQAALNAYHHHHHYHKVVHQKSHETQKDKDGDLCVFPPNSEWLWSLLNTHLFHPCPQHSNLRKNECNFFCFGVNIGVGVQNGNGSGMALCRHCLATQTEGSSGTIRMFQIRRYMYQNVVHAEDLASTRYDLSGIQAYCINSKRAILLHPKPAPPTAQATPAFENKCRGCLIPLRPDCMYCSLRCKVDVDFGHEPATPFLSTAPGPMKSVKGTSVVSGAETHYIGVGRTDSMITRRWSSHDSISFAGSKRRKLVCPQRSHAM